MTIVAQFSWDDIASPDFGNPARIAWREAVAEIAEKAKATLPDCNGRVEKAAAIVLAGDVELLEGGKAKVASQSNGTTQYFVVNGECQCKDYPKAPSQWCKHRIAAGIHKRATALAKHKLTQLDGASEGQTTTASEDAPAGEAQVWRSNTPPVPGTPLPEAPVSITLKATLHGHEVMVTLRGVDFASVKAQVEDASQWLQGQSSQPTADTPQCPIHHVPLKRQQKDGRSWWSHKTADGWCKGK
jgi:hypothetical protein